VGRNHSSGVSGPRIGDSAFARKFFVIQASFMNSGRVWNSVIEIRTQSK
jgi:hypothetical protein